MDTAGAKQLRNHTTCSIEKMTHRREASNHNPRHFFPRQELGSHGAEYVTPCVCYAQRINASGWLRKEVRRERYVSPRKPWPQTSKRAMRGFGLGTVKNAHPSRTTATRAKRNKSLCLVCSNPKLSCLSPLTAFLLPAVSPPSMSVASSCKFISTSCSPSLHMQSEGQADKRAGRKGKQHAA